MNPEQNSLDQNAPVQENTTPETTPAPAPLDSIIPEEPNPLPSDSQAPESGAIGSELNPSSFNIDPLLNSSTSITEPAEESITKPSIQEATPAKDKKPLNKGLVIAAIVTVLNIAISTTAVIISVNSGKKSQQENPTPTAIAEEDILPGTLQCKIDECLSLIKSNDSITSIKKKLGIEPKAPSTYEFALNKNTILTARYGSGLRVDLEIKNPLEYSKITTKKDDIKAKFDISSTSKFFTKKDEEITYKEFCEYLGNIEGTLIDINYGYYEYKTYLWSNPTESFTIEAKFEKDNLYSIYLENEG